MVSNAFIDEKMCTNKALGGGLKVQQRRKIVATNSDDNTTTTGLAGISHPENGKLIKKTRRSKSAVVGVALNLRDKLYIRRVDLVESDHSNHLKGLKNVKMAGVATTTFNSSRNLHVYNGSDLSRSNWDERKIRNKPEKQKVPKGVELDNKAMSEKKLRRKPFEYPQGCRVLVRGLSESMAKSRNEVDTVNRRMLLRKANGAQSSSNKECFTGKYSVPHTSNEQKRHDY